MPIHQEPLPLIDHSWCNAVTICANCYCDCYVLSIPVTLLMLNPFFFCSAKDTLLYPCTRLKTCLIVKSGSTPVGGPVKSGRKQTKDKGRGLDKKLVQPELVTAWIQRLRTTSVDPLRRFWSRGWRRKWRWRQRQTETGVVTKLISD